MFHSAPMYPGMSICNITFGFIIPTWQVQWRALLPVIFHWMKYKFLVDDFIWSCLYQMKSHRHATDVSHPLLIHSAHSKQSLFFVSSLKSVLFFWVHLFGLDHMATWESGRWLLGPDGWIDESSVTDIMHTTLTLANWKRSKICLCWMLRYMLRVEEVMGEKGLEKWKAGCILV